MAKTSKTTKTAKTVKTAKKVDGKKPDGATAKKATAKKSEGERKVIRKTWADDARDPPKGKSVLEACIELMRKPGGCGIKDFQQIKGFNLPSMAVVRAAEKRGYKATATKEQGSRTIYKATGSAK